MGERCKCIIVTDASASFAVGEGMRQAAVAAGQPLRIVAKKGPPHDTGARYAMLFSVTAPPTSVQITCRSLFQSVVTGPLEPKTGHVQSILCVGMCHCPGCSEVKVEGWPFGAGTAPVATGAPQRGHPSPGGVNHRHSC